SLDELSYSTYIQNRTSDTAAPGLVLRLDTTGDGVANERLYFEPYYNGPGRPVQDQGSTAPGVWQTWDASIGAWWQWSISPPSSPGWDGPYTLEDFVDALPDGTRIVADPQTTGGGLHILVGSGGPWANFTGNVDA